MVDVKVCMMSRCAGGGLAGFATIQLYPNLDVSNINDVIICCGSNTASSGGKTARPGQIPPARHGFRPARLDFPGPARPERRTGPTDTDIYGERIPAHWFSSHSLPRDRGFSSLARFSTGPTSRTNIDTVTYLL